MFKVPIELPSTRAQDHVIKIKPDSVPTNVRPYQYPYFQKNEIVKIIQEMLHMNHTAKYQPFFFTNVVGAQER